MYKIACSLLLLLLPIIGWGQETSAKQRELELKKEQILKEISEARSKLNSEKAKEKDVLTQLKEQEQKIKLIEQLIATTEKQKHFLDDAIYLQQKEINALQKELLALKADYSKMIQKSYKSRNEKSRVMFVLSSSSFLQAYKRIQYMKQYADFRKIQGEEIKEKNLILEGKQRALEVQKQQKVKILKETEKDKKELDVEKAEKKRLVQTIKKDQKKITAEINKKKQETAKIDKQIKQLIRQAIAEANRKAKIEADRKAAAAAAATAAANKAKGIKTTTPTKAVTASKASVSSAKVILSKEGEALSNNFKNNKGRLPWPTDNGVVSSKYGIQPHPVYPNLTVDNSGVEIKVDNGSTARVVFEGEVVQIQLFGNMKGVLVQHGEYFTLYKNLSSVQVSVGDKVKTKQILGKIHTPSNGRSTLMFYVFRNADNMNPAAWISNM